MAEQSNTAENTTAATSASNVDLPAFYGFKAGMTRIFDEQGNHVPVTVIRLTPNKVSQVKTKEKDGYTAYQVAYYEKREKLIPEPSKGHLKKAGLEPKFARFSEVRLSEVEPANLGKEVSYGFFPANTYVDITGMTKGKGFQGVVKKFGFAGGPASHGSHFHRRAGSIGNRATPARVFAEKKMPGHLGCDNQSVQNLKVVELNLEKGYMLIKGSVPGSKNSLVCISKATKKQ